MSDVNKLHEIFEKLIEFYNENKYLMNTMVALRDSYENNEMTIKTKFYYDEIEEIAIMSILLLNEENDLDDEHHKITTILQDKQNTFMTTYQSYDNIEEKEETYFNITEEKLKKIMKETNLDMKNISPVSVEVFATHKNNKTTMSDYIKTSTFDSEQTPSP